MSDLFFLNSNKYMFSTYINDNTLLITCPDRTKVDLLNFTLTRHKERTNKWLNRGLKYTIQGVNRDILDLTENHVEHDELKEFQLTYISINDAQDVNFINQLYELYNTKLFMMYDYEYDANIPLLSLQGILIRKPEMESMFSLDEYLNAVMEIENTETNLKSVIDVDFTINIDSDDDINKLSFDDYTNRDDN